ncbi:MAG: hypothetical protein IID08_05640 [Candidatus Hydrogenedentes bacterium]|nr:hypothetical protein [Candidatus Hydrogenedentota bacterium]
MQAFRADEQSATENVEEDLEASAVIGRRRKSGTDGISMEPAFDDLPTLDEGNQDILGMGLKSDSESGSSAPRKSGLGVNSRARLILVAKLAGVLMVLLFVGVKGIGWARAYVEERGREERPRVVNRAPAMIERGSDTLKILDAASQAVTSESNSENLKILETALALVVDAVESHLNSWPWDLDELNEASRMAAEALRIHPNATTIALDKQAGEDNVAYRMVLTSVDTREGTATFTLNRAGAPTVTVKKGEIVGDRFVFRNIIGREKIRMLDTLRENRPVTFPVGGLPE